MKAFFLKILVTLLGNIKAFRAFYGGTWARCTKTSELGETSWIPFVSKYPIATAQMVSDGQMELEVYK